MPRPRTFAITCLTLMEPIAPTDADQLRLVLRPGHGRSLHLLFESEDDLYNFIKNLAEFAQVYCHWRHRYDDLFF